MSTKKGITTSTRSRRLRWILAAASTNLSIAINGHVPSATTDIVTCAKQMTMTGGMLDPHHSRCRIALENCGRCRHQKDHPGFLRMRHLLQMMKLEVSTRFTAQRDRIDRHQMDRCRQKYPRKVPLRKRNYATAGNNTERTPIASSHPKHFVTQCTEPANIVCPSILFFAFVYLYNSLQ